MFKVAYFLVMNVLGEGNEGGTFVIREVRIGDLILTAVWHACKEYIFWQLPNRRGVWTRR
jgi:hypothetical protein